MSDRKQYRKRMFVCVAMCLVGPWIVRLAGPKTTFAGLGGALFFVGAVGLLFTEVVHFVHRIRDDVKHIRDGGS